MKKSDLKILKNETEKILDCAIELCTKYNDKSGYFENNVIKPLESEKEKLENNEYLIAFLGSVKAGKSTLINALLGRKLNPTQHEAKTALPNLITHDKMKKEPFLKIKSEIFDDLVEFAKSKQKDLNLEKSYQGESEIYKFLDNLNDIYREFLKEKSEDEIENFMRKFKNIDDFPRILVDFGDEYKLSKNCKITFIDTPGANEAKISSHLRKIFNDTLQRASKVVMVVDYSNIDKDSDNELFDEFLENTKAIQNNKEAILLVANKIDNLTNKEDMEAQVIKDKICNRFENKIKSENILPFSGKWAKIANEALRELKKENPDIKILDESYNRIKDLENIKEIANEDLEKSNINELKTIIQNSFKNTDEKILFSSLYKIKGILQEYILNAIKVKQSNFKKSSEEIEQEIKQIEQNQNQLKEKIPNITKKFEKELNIVIESSQNLLNKYYPSSETNTKEEDEEIGLFDLFKNVIQERRQNEVIYPDEVNEILEQIDDIFEKNSKNEIKCAKQVEKAFRNGFMVVIKKLEENLEPNLKKLEQNIQVNIENEILKNIENIKQNLGDDINIKIPFLKNKGDDDYEIEIMTTQKRTETYWVDDDYLGAGIIRWVDDLFGTKRHWGQTKKTRTIEENVLDSEKAKENICLAWVKKIKDMKSGLSEFENEVSNAFKDRFENLEQKIDYLLRIKENSLKKDSDKNEKDSAFFANDSEFYKDLIARLEVSTNLSKE